MPGIGGQDAKTKTPREIKFEIKSSISHCTTVFLLMRNIIVGHQNLTHGSTNTTQEWNTVRRPDYFSTLDNTDGDHLDGGARVVIAGGNLGNLVDKIHVFGNLKNCMIRKAFPT